MLFTHFEMQSETARSPFSLNFWRSAVVPFGEVSSTTNLFIQSGTRSIGITMIHVFRSTRSVIFIVSLKFQS
jgi:hypothetical protein